MGNLTSRLRERLARRRGKGGGESFRASESGVESVNRQAFILDNRGSILDHYLIERKKLGQGTYGNVSRARHKKTEETRAVKTISKNQLGSIDRFKQEISIMRSLDHPNVVKLYETFENRKYIYLVMELCSGGELFDRIIEKGSFTEKDTAVLLKQICQALHYMHSLCIMHRDLKPENFLFLNKTKSSPLKIIDFGLSARYQPGGTARTKAGTPYYVCPQVLLGKYNEKCDIWSAGVILYILLCGYPPFCGDTDGEVLQRVKQGNYAFSGPEWKKVSDSAKDLVRKMLKMDPRERLSAQQVLAHPWVSGHALDRPVALPGTFVSNLKNFQTQGRLKRAALTVIAQHVNDTNVEQLRALFLEMDTDNSGRLTVEELREGLEKKGIPLTQDLHAQLYEGEGGQTELVYTEFIAAAMDENLYSQRSAVLQAFQVFDTDGDGTISKDELMRALNLQDTEQTAVALKELLNEVDANGDDLIDFDEFFNMMKKMAHERRIAPVQADLVTDRTKLEQ